MYAPKAHLIKGALRSLVVVVVVVVIAVAAAWHGFSWEKYRVTKRKMPPTKMLIMSTCFQRITSYLVHINSSLCMIIPQSLQFVGQIVRLLCSLLNVFQMTPLALEAHLQAAHETVNDTSTFLYGDCPDPGCNCCLQVTDCFRTIGLSDNPQR